MKVAHCLKVGAIIRFRIVLRFFHQRKISTSSPSSHDGAEASWSLTATTNNLHHRIYPNITHPLGKPQHLGAHYRSRNALKKGLIAAMTTTIAVLAALGFQKFSCYLFLFSIMNMEDKCCLVTFQTQLAGFSSICSHSNVAWLEKIVFGT